MPHAACLMLRAQELMADGRRGQVLMATDGGKSSSAVRRAQLLMPTVSQPNTSRQEHQACMQQFNTPVTRSVCECKSSWQEHATSMTSRACNKHDVKSMQRACQGMRSLGRNNLQQQPTIASQGLTRAGLWRACMPSLALTSHALSRTLRSHRLYTP
jgi:hypothetical protein